MEDLERIKQRLDNITSVAPILTALRNIAAGSWRLARSRLGAARIFAEELANIARAIDPSLATAAAETKAGGEEAIGLLVIASERGLCGSFNSVVLEAAQGLAEEQRELGRSVRFMTLGGRATTHMQRRGIATLYSAAMPMTTVPSLAFVQQVLGELRGLLKDGMVQRIHAVYTPYQTRVSAKPVLRQILPSEIQLPEAASTTWPEAAGGTWPPAIIDSPPALLREYVKRQWEIVEFYRVVLESAASEQSARFRVLEAASGNCERLTEELTLSYHAARQHAITMEMLDLVGGAGLLKSADSDSRAAEG